MSNLNSLDRVLTSHGYAIKKSSLTPKSIQKLRKDLTVQPQISQKFARAASSTAFSVYTESATRFYIPRAWANEVYGKAEAEAIPEGLCIKDNYKLFKGTPFPYQESIIQAFFDKDANGLICVPCGRGKTFMALAIAARIGKRFLVVVDKEFLMNQWRGEMKNYMPNLRVGILQSDKCETDPEKYDVTICMIQTLVQRDFPQNIFHSYGFTIFDECHHLGAAHFSRSLLKVQTKHMLGLSATPVRDDGLTKVFEWFLGKPVYWEKTRDPDPHVIVKCVKFTTKDPSYNEIPTDYRGEMIMARLLTKIVECKERTELIARIIRDACEDDKRRILVLSERIGHLKSIEELLKDSGLSMSYYVGGMKEEVRESGAATARILLASYAMASEAMNIKTLNTVVLASPRRKVEQSTGRILRVQKDQRQVAPLIIDIVDSHGVYQGQWRMRAQYYKKCSYRIQIGDQDESDTFEKDEEKSETDFPDGCLILDD